MRSTNRIIVIVLVIALALALFTGCGSTSPSGKYYIKSVNGVSIEEFISSKLKEDGIALEDFLKECGINSVEEYIVFEFKGDGILIKYFPGLDPVTRTWKQDGNKIIMTEDGHSTECTIKGNEFSYKANDTEYIFIKK